MAIAPILRLVNMGVGAYDRVGDLMKMHELIPVG
jgi:hypothetical protein